MISLFVRCGRLINLHVFPLFICNFIHLPRPGPHYGGGVGVLYSNALKLIQSSDLSLDNSEALSCTFHPPKSQPLTIIIIYRPPNNSIPYFIDEIDNLFSMISTNSILLGDFNIPILPNSHN